MIMMSLSLHTFVGSSLENDNSWWDESQGTRIFGAKDCHCLFFFGAFAAAILHTLNLMNCLCVVCVADWLAGALDLLLIIQRAAD